MSGLDIPDSQYGTIVGRRVGRTVAYLSAVLGPRHRVAVLSRRLRAVHLHVVVTIELGTHIVRRIVAIYTAMLSLLGCIEYTKMCITQPTVTDDPVA